jgi:hypothetical protein
VSDVVASTEDSTPDSTPDSIGDSTDRATIENTTEAVAREPSRAARVGVLCLFLTALIGIGTPLVGHRVFLGADLLHVYSPWRTFSSLTAEHHLVFSDTVDFYTPQRLNAAKQLRAGELPWWNPYPAGGTPLASIPDTAVFSPLNLPWLILPGWLAPAYNALVGLGVAALGMYLFLRRLRLSKLPAVIGGAAYMTTGFMTSWTGWPHAHVAALVPGLFWAIERALQRGTWRSAVPVALVLATMWAEGFPAVTGFAIYAAVIYVIVRLLATMPRPVVREHLQPLLRARARIGAVVAGGLALGSGLIAFQLIPFVKHLSVIDIDSRLQRPTLHLPLSAIATVMLPFAFGSPEATANPRGNYFGPNNLIEINAFVGAAVLVCIVALIAWKRPRRVPAGACTALSVIVAVTAVAVYHGGFVLAVLQKFPVFSNNPIRRATAILDFALPALAAIGIERVLAERERLRDVARWRVAATWVLGALAVIGVVAKVVSLAGPSHQRGWVFEHALIPFACAVVTAGVLWFAARSARGVPVLRLVLPIVVLVEGLAFVLPWWPSSARSDFYPTTATHSFLEQHLGPDRYAAEGGTMLQSSNTYYELRAVTAHAFRQPSWADLVKAIEPKVTQPPTQLFLGEDLGSLPSPVLDRLSARYFVADPVRPIPGTSVPAPVATSSITLSGGVNAFPVTLPSTPRGLRAVTVQLARPLASSGTKSQRFSVDLMDGNRVVATGFRDLNDGWAAGGLAIAVPETDARVTGATLTYSGPNPITLSTASNERVAVGGIEDPGDGARVVLSGDAVVYERTHSLPRVRWMSNSTVISATKPRIAALVGGTVPLNTVVLSSGQGVTPGSGRAASAFHLTTDDPDHIRVDVTASGSGFVEIADAIQHGWTATVDGHSAKLLDADNALVAVDVPAGHHVIDVSYHATGQRAGFAVSFLAFLVMLALLGWPMVQAPRRRTLAVPSGSDTGSGPTS